MNTKSATQTPDAGEVAIRSVPMQWQFTRPERVRVRGRAAWRRGLDCEHGTLLEPAALPSRWETRNRA